MALYLYVYYVLTILNSANSFTNHNVENSYFVGNTQTNKNMLNELETAKKSAIIIAQHEYEQNNWLPAQGIHMTRNTTGFFRFNTGKLPFELAQRQQQSQIIIKTLQVYLNKHTNCEPQEIMQPLYDARIKAVNICKKLKQSCCEVDAKYRTYDGSCNNNKYSTWGSSQTPFTRLIRPAYHDWISKPRLSGSGKELPSARRISTSVFNDHLSPDSRFSMLASQMAQFLAHDTHQALPDNVDDGPIQCCSNNGDFLPAALLHTSCMPIPIPYHDQMFIKYKQKCMNFIRSVTVPRTNCIVGPAEQVNMVSSFLDCSFVYGNDENMAYKLRTLKDGKLKESSPNKNRMLPLTEAKHCDFRQETDECYIAGDSRVNQNPHLVAMHVVFLREHNRLAHELKKLNTHWEDEKLFQEARRILIAQYQHIVYKEYLPVFIGKKIINKLFKNCDETGFTTNYNEKLNPGSINSMNIAFRCYHSTLPDKIKLCNENCKTTSQHTFSKYMARPALCKNNHDQILNSLCCNPMIKISDGFSHEITDKMFKSTSKFGLDLLAMDIQRERDHGIPGYNKFREISGLKKAKDFDDFSEEISRDKIEKLRQIYEHVDDVDFIVGAQLEQHVPGTEFGPVILHILQQQFKRYMLGDRFFYTNKVQDYPFTTKQLQEIEKSSIARLICDNGNNIKTIQSKAFLKETEKNKRKQCSEIPKIDLSPWKNT